MEIARQLLPLIRITPERIRNYQTFWEDVGACLYSVSRGDAYGLTTWQEWTATVTQSSMADVAAVCEHSWTEKLRNANSIHTLGEWCREDSVAEYNEWHHSWATTAVLDIFSSRINSEKLAQAFYRCFWIDFRIPKPRCQTWSVWSHGRWESISSTKIKEHIRDIFFPYLRQVAVDRKLDLTKLNRALDKKTCVGGILTAAKMIFGRMETSVAPVVLEVPIPEDVRQLHAWLSRACDWNSAYTVGSTDLARAYGTACGIEVDCRATFPKWMRSVVQMEPRISRIDGRRVVYSGLRLKIVDIMTPVSDPTVPLTPIGTPRPMLQRSSTQKTTVTIPTARLIDFGPD